MFTEFMRGLYNPHIRYGNGLMRTAQLAILCLLAIPFGPAAGAIQDRTGGWTPRTPKGLPRIEQRMLEDAGDGRLDEFCPLEAALVAGGVSDSGELAAYRRRFARWCRTLRQSETVRGMPEERAKAVFRFMHREILTGAYRADCNSLAETFDRGDFNCLGATILYNSLGKQFGVYLAAVETPGHVRSRLLADAPLDVETTCRRWSDARSEAKPRASGKGPPLPADRGREGRPRRITPVQLVARVYYNRGVTLLESERYPAAVDVVRLSLRLDPKHREASENLLAGLNNWALMLCRQDRYDQAAAKLDELRRLAPEYGPLAQNDLHVHQRWVLSLCRAQRYAEALRLLERGHVRRPNVDLFDAGRVEVYRVWVRSLEEVGRAAEAAAVSADAQRRFPQRREAFPYWLESRL